MINVANKVEFHKFHVRFCLHWYVILLRELNQPNVLIATATTEMILLTNNITWSQVIAVSRKDILPARLGNYFLRRCPSLR